MKQELNILAEIKPSLHKANCWGVFGLTSRQKSITILDLCLNIIVRRAAGFAIKVFIASNVGKSSFTVD